MARELILARTLSRAVRTMFQNLFRCQISETLKFTQAHDRISVLDDRFRLQSTQPVDFT